MRKRHWVHRDHLEPEIPVTVSAERCCRRAWALCRAHSLLWSGDGGPDSRPDHGPVFVAPIGLPDPGPSLVRADGPAHRRPIARPDPGPHSKPIVIRSIALPDPDSHRMPVLVRADGPAHRRPVVKIENVVRHCDLDA